VDLNFGPQAVYPQVELPVQWPEDLTALAGALEKLTPLGLDAPLSWVRSKWNVPEPQDGEATLGAPAAPAAEPPAALGPGFPPRPAPQRSLQAQAPAPLDAQAQIDLELARDATPAQQAAMARLLAPIMDSLRDGLTPEEIMARMDTWYQHLDDTLLQALLTRGLAAAEAIGRLDLTAEPHG
jgi:phage gp29-like protein